LALAGEATIAASPHILIGASGVLDASWTSSGGIALSHQTLTIDGGVKGNVTVGDNATVSVNSDATLDGDLLVQSGGRASGAGGVVGNVVAQAGSLLRVGGDGMPTTSAPVTTLIDDFGDMDVAEYDQTIVNDGNAGTPNVAFSASGGALAARYEGAPTHEQVLLLRDDVSLAVGQTLLADVAMGTTTQQFDLGIAISADATPAGASGGAPDTRATFDWASIAVRPDQNGIRVNRSVDGVVDTTTGAQGGVAETTVAGLYITRISANQFQVGYTDSGLVSHDAAVINFGDGAVAGSIGFYTDLRFEGALGNLDNLRIVGANGAAAVGETLTVEGNLSIEAGAALALDIFDPATRDRLAVTGGFTASGGTLQVTLEPGAPAPALDDQFDILDFATAEGAFEAFDLPALASGLAWNVSRLFTAGELEVVEDVDFDNDGDVDGADFLLTQRNDPSLIPAWQAQFGNLLVTPGGNESAVPEPATGLNFGFAASFVMLRRRMICSSAVI
jgi:hypothetical protein